MSEENIEVVRQALDAIGRRDLPAILDHADPSIELHPLLSVWRRTYRGHEGIERWWRDVAELWDEFDAHADGFRDLGGGTLVVRVRWRGRAKGATAEVEGPAAVVVRFRGDKAVSVDVYIDETRALAAISGA